MAFEKKLNELFSITTKNQFVNQALKVTHETTSENGALKYNTTGDVFVDNFAAISHFKEPREYSKIAKDMEHLWSIDPLMCLKLAVYIRTITRKSRIVKKDTIEVLDTQRGQGLKNEGIIRMMWLAINQPKTFKANFNYFISAGSWKDVFQMMSIDLQYNGWDNRKLDWTFLYNVISAGLVNPETTHLVRKYMPTIRTNKNCSTLESQANTLIGRWLARKLSPGLEKEKAYKVYRKVKADGVAHQWQQLISKQLYDAINFNKIAGRALSLLVGSKFLENHGLTNKYKEWIQSKPTAKYTGFVFELFSPLGDRKYSKHIEDYQEVTINAQFAQLVETGRGKENTNTGLLVIRDTSSSMESKARGCNMSAFGIAKAMALYFSEFLTGPFAGSFAEFANECKLHQWKGSTPCDKWINDSLEAYGGTNFQSVIDLLIKVKNSGINERDFPTGILCISDGELDPAIKDWKGNSSNNSTNFKVALSRLREAGFSEEYVTNFKIILWDIPNYYYGDNKVKFEDFADAPNFFYISGYDPSAVSFILEGTEFKATPRNARELFEVAMNQELLNKLTIIKSRR